MEGKKRQPDKQTESRKDIKRKEGKTRRRKVSSIVIQNKVKEILKTIKNKTTENNKKPNKIVHFSEKH